MMTATGCTCKSAGTVDGTASYSWTFNNNRKKFLETGSIEGYAHAFTCGALGHHSQGN